MANVRVCRAREVWFKHTFQPANGKRTFPRVFQTITRPSILASLGALRVLEVVGHWLNGLLMFIDFRNPNEECLLFRLDVR